MLLAAVIAVGAGYVLHMREIADTDLIFPNVVVAGVNVGGMTKEEAKEAILAAVDGQYERNELQIRLPDRTLTLTPDLTKVHIDVDAVVDLAWDYGRETSFWKTAKAFLAAESDNYVINIDDAITLDSSAVRLLIDQTAAEVEQPLIRSEVLINTDRNTITVTQGQTGRRLDADQLYAAVMNAYSNNDFTTLTMDYAEQEPDPVNLLSIYDQYCYPAVDATYDAATGKYTEASSGLTFDFENENAIVAGLQPGQSYTIQMQVVEPKITAEMLMKDMFADLLSEYSSPYVWNPDRTTNLRLACEEIDGTIVGVGETFSFNDTVGERTAARGFQPAAVYVGVATADEVGGGVCQVASTLYNCALMANLEIVERTEHRYLVTYVDKGMDATIYWGLHDFKFKNTTEYPMKIKAWLENNCVNIQFFGTNTTGEYARMTFEVLGTQEFKDEIVVDLEKSPTYENVTQTAYRGYTVQTYRHVYNAEGQEISVTKEARSVYSARDRITVVGYGNPRIPDDYEYPEGTVFPELPEEDPDTQDDDPRTPDDPDEPDEPDEPDTPDEPAEPDEPDVPDVPDEPDTPDVPNEPDTPDTPDDPGDTGDDGFVVAGDG